MAGPEKFTIDLSKISLTTVQGYLGAIALAIGGMAPVFLLYGHPKAAATCGMVSMLIGTLKGPLGQLQGDANRTVATTPDDPTPHGVAAHPIPDDPNAVPVIK